MSSTDHDFEASLLPGSSVFAEAMHQKIVCWGFRMMWSEYLSTCSGRRSLFAFAYRVFGRRAEGGRTVFAG